MREEIPYNPLDKRNLGESVADTLLFRELLPLGNLENFTGAGIYALYYSGGLSVYQPISLSTDSSNIPIYIGKAVPPGARKGNFGLNTNPGMALFSRLNEHAKSINQASNINIEDFKCRYLVVDDIWIPLGESLLVAKFSPVWNKVIDGFGNHDPGSGRYKQLRSRWDTLHPGRKWALKCQERTETAAQIEAELNAYFQAAPNL